jgi:Kdo2-lipid IVA lauroyltransferase/acyltransferase
MTPQRAVGAGLVPDGMRDCGAAPPARRAPGGMNPLRRLYKRSHRLRRFVRRRKDAAVYQLVRFALWLPRRVSLPRALALADRVGDLIYATLSQTRQLALDHLTLAFGEQLSVSEREQIARASFRNVARCFVELAKFDVIRERFDDYAEIDGWQHWETVRAGGRGAIAITGHIGNWELLAAYVARKGTPIAAIARRLNDPRLNHLLSEFRISNGVRTILREGRASSREILKVLNERGILALLIDQDIITPSLSVPFFGRPARTPAAAAILAVRRGVPVIACFAERRAGGGLRFVIMPPIYPPESGDRQRDILELTRRFSAALENQIRHNPTEWVWWHKRWRRPPIARLDLDAKMQ